MAGLRRRFPVLHGDGRQDDTASIQMRLDAGVALVALPMPKKEYLISRSLLIGDGQELRLPEQAHIRLADGSNCVMLTNRDRDGGNRDVKITGGIWDMNNAGQRHNVAALGWMTPEKRAEWLTEEKERVQKSIPWPKTYAPDFFTGVCVQFFNVKGLVIKGITVRNPVTYGIQFSRVCDFSVEDVVFDYIFGNPAKANMDGLHIDGGCARGRISRLRGICFDDFVALNATDGADSPFYGPIEDIAINGIDCDYCHSAVRLLSRSPLHPVRRVSIRNVKGRFYSYGVGLTYFHRDVKERGVMEDISIRDCCISRAEPPADCWGFWRFGAIEVEQGLDIGSLEIERLSRDEDHRGDIATIRVKEGARIDHLSICDCIQTNRTRDAMVFLRCRGVVKDLAVERVRLVSAPGRNVLEDFGPIPEDQPRTEINPLVVCRSGVDANPGPCAPSGFVRTGPVAVEKCPGRVAGFAVWPRESGGGAMQPNAIVMLPFTGDVPTAKGCAVDTYTETARTAYYGAWLVDCGVHVELTASPHVAWQRWTFPRDNPRRVLVSLPSGGRFAFSRDSKSFSGALSDRWRTAFEVAFCEPWVSCRILSSGVTRRFVVEFVPEEHPLVVRVAFSSTGREGVKRNMVCEAPTLDFDRAYSLSLYAWEKVFRGAAPKTPASKKIRQLTEIYLRGDSE